MVIMTCKHNRIIKQIFSTGKQTVELEKQYEEKYVCAHCGCIVLVSFVGNDSTVS